MLQTLTISNFSASSGLIQQVVLSYQLFGCPLHTAPVVLVNHALTGNSNVAGREGWWNKIIGSQLTIDTDHCTVLCFNIPDNGFDGSLQPDAEVFITSDIARLFLAGLQQLQIEKLQLLIGGSLGGAIGWEMLALKPDLAEIFIPVACDYRTSDWLHSQCLVQQFLLSHQDDPLQKARAHAMLCYRTPASLNDRFQNVRHAETRQLKSHDWLNFHGKTLEGRFSIQAYQLMNRLLMTVDADADKLKKIQAKIHLIAIDSDLLFPAFEMKKAAGWLRQFNSCVTYQEISSPHGHDAFLIEYPQLHSLLKSHLS